MPDAVKLLTFLLTDIEGSSLKWLNHRGAMQSALAVHDRILRETICQDDGEVFKTAGDAFFAVFKTPAAAVRAAVRAQKALAGTDWSNVDGLRVRMALHTGTAEHRDDDYFGPALNRVARLLPLGHGGQILATDSVARLVMSERETEAGMLLGRHPLDDPAQAVEIYQIRAPGLSEEFPALRLRDAQPTNLPQQTTPLIGRDNDLRQLVGYLQSSRLVSLTGPGGIGKTHLAIEGGRKRLSNHADGAWFVEFAPISDASLVASMVATTLGVKLSPNMTPLQGLINQLKAMDALIILDNCEHVIGAVAELTEQLLSATERLRILATSQEQLGVSGEQTFPLPPLSVPDEGTRTAADALLAGSVQLFVDLAKAASPRFAFNDQLAPIVSAICRRLDGIPLAIAMAAARAPALGVHKLVELLDQRFRVLTGGRRTALPRQQTLRATLDWSFGLLPERDKTVFRRLGVFAGGLTLEGALAVAADERIDDLDAIEAVSSLVAKSLVSVTGNESRPRYRLLETARLYALEKVAEAGESERLAHRHAEHVRSFYAACWEDFWRLSDADFLESYRPDLDNLRVAIEWAFAPGGDSETGIALVGSTSELWTALSLNSELERRVAVAFEHVGSDTDDSLQGALWYGRSRTLRERAPDKAREAGERAVALYRKLGDPLALAGGLLALITGLGRSGRMDAISGQLDELGQLANQLGSARLKAEYEFVLGLCQHIRGETVKAIAPIERAAVLAREAGAEALALAAGGGAGEAYWALHDLDRALAATRDNLIHRKRSLFSRRPDLAYDLANIHGILVERGNLDEAEAIAGETLTVLREVGLGWCLLDHFALYAAKRGDVQKAARIAGYVAATSITRQSPRQPNEARAYESTIALLKEGLSKDKLESLLAEGAMLNDEQACKLAEAQTV